MYRRLAAAIHHFFFELRMFGRELLRLAWLPVEAFRPTNFREKIARDSKDLLASSQMVAVTTTSTATGVLRLILSAPLAVPRWIVQSSTRYWHYLITRSPITLVLGLGFSLVAAGAVAWPAYTVIHERRIENLRLVQYKLLDDNFTQINLSGVRHNLSVLQLKSPQDAAIAARLAALDAGCALDDDPKMARVLMRDHYGKHRFAEACREARKYLEYEVQDWEALLILAEHALRRGDREGSAGFVAKLPLVGEAREWATPWSCSVAARLFRELGDAERLNDVIEFAVTKYVSRVIDPFVVQFEPEARMQLIELYNLALSQPARLADLKGYFVPYQSLAHGIANAPNASTPVLVALGMLQEAQLEPSLREMAKQRIITADEYRLFAAEMEDRLRLIWRRVREADPKQMVGYVGPAMQQARAGNLRGAVETIDAGIATAGRLPELVEHKANLLAKYDPAGSLAYLDAIMADEKLTLPLCKVVAEAGLAAGRPDKALAAVNRAKEIQPGMPWACKLEAEVLMQVDRPTEAAAVLQKILPMVVRDPNLSMMYVRALSKSGAAGLAIKYLRDAIEQQQTGVAISAGASVLAQMGHAGEAVEILRRLIARDPMNVPAQIFLADCLREQAERDPAGWPRELVDEALKHYRYALQRQPRNLFYVNNVAWLELVAKDLPREAYQSALPLIEAPLADLAPEFLETRGAVLIGVGKHEQARIALEASIQKSGPRATAMAFLALAYHGLNQSARADECIREAVKLPKLNPRQAEMVSAARAKVSRGVR